MADIVTPPPFERVRRSGIVAWSLIGVLILIGLALWSLMHVRAVFPPIVLALLLIYLLNPIVTGLERRGMRRLIASCIAYLVLLGLVAVALTVLVPAFIDQGQTFARHFPQTSRRVDHFARDVSTELDRRFHVKVDPNDLIGRRSLARKLGRSLGGLLKGAVQTLALLVIGLVLSFYLVIDLPRLQRAALRLIPPSRRDEWREVASHVGTAMGGFFRGQLLVALIVGILSAAALRVIGLPYWLVIGMIAGLFNLVPLVGPFIGAIPAVLVAATFKPPIFILWAALALTIVQQIDNHFISPNVMRLTVRLHPVTVMLSLTAGAALAGFWGMLVTVPIVASVKMVLGHLWKTRVPWGEEVFDEGDKMEGVGPEQVAPDGGHASSSGNGKPAVLGARDDQRERPAVLPLPGAPK